MGHLVRKAAEQSRATRHDARAGGPPGDHGASMSTRALIIAALVCGVAILVAFAVQVLTLT